MLCREFVITCGSVSGSIRNAVRSELGGPAANMLCLFIAQACDDLIESLGLRRFLSIRDAVRRESRELNGRYVKTICPGVPLHGNRDLFWAPCLWSVGESCLDGSFGHHALGAILP